MNPAYQSISELFEYKPCYVIPKYQRAYAWGGSQVDDFISDLTKIFNKRKNDSPEEHFFGGIICVDWPYPGAQNVNRYEVIDGQQRLTTFSILANIIIDKYKQLLQESELNEITNVSQNCRTQIKDLESRFRQFDQVISGEQKVVDVIRLSRRDKDFYSELIHGDDPAPEKESHFKLQHASEQIIETVNSFLSGIDILKEKFKVLQILEAVLTSDFKILTLVTNTKKDAYRLFQVINDRGTSLTDADLIRCKVLELMEGNNSQQNVAEKLLDDIVSYENTEEQLSWVYESKFGKKPRSDSMFDDYMANYFSVGDLESLNSGEVEELLIKVRELHNSINLVRELLLGDWPYEHQAPVTVWDRDRLSVLVEYLGNTASIPILISATALDHCDFSEIIQMLERFFYRYKIICGGHNTSLKKVYSKNSLLINSDPCNFDVNNLRVDLNSLLEEKTTDISFMTFLDEFFYSRRGGNKPIKHLLLMVDQYARWFDQGAIGCPDCIDKSRIIDRKEGTTIEHIYPKGIGEDSENYSSNMDNIKNSIKNLTILSATENTLAGTESFDQKKIVFSKSSSYLTRKVSEKEQWGVSEAGQHSEYIKAVALKTFKA